MRSGARVLGTTAGLALLLLGLPSGAAAQAPTAQQVSQIIQAQDRVRVKLASGKVWRGRFFQVTADAIELSSIGRTRKSLLLTQIRQIEIDLPDPVSDSAKRGAWIGLGIGGGFAALAALATCQGLGDCAGFLVPAAFISGIGLGIGAAAGALGDAMVTDTRVVWPAASASASRPVGVGLVATPGRLSVALTARW